MAVVGELGDRGLTEDRLDRQRRLLIRSAGDHDTPGGPFAEMRRRGSRLVPYVEAQMGPQARPDSVAELHKYGRVQVNLDGGARTCARWSVSAASYIYRPLR